MLGIMNKAIAQYYLDMKYTALKCSIFKVSPVWHRFGAPCYYSHTRDKDEFNAISFIKIHEDAKEHNIM